MRLPGPSARRRGRTNTVASSNMRLLNNLTRKRHAHKASPRLTSSKERDSYINLHRFRRLKTRSPGEMLKKQIHVNPGACWFRNRMCRLPKCSSSLSMVYVTRSGTWLHEFQSDRTGPKHGSRTSTKQHPAPLVRSGECSRCADHNSSRVGGEWEMGEKEDVSLNLTVAMWI